MPALRLASLSIGQGAAKFERDGEFSIAAFVELRDVKTEGKKWTL